MSLSSSKWKRVLEGKKHQFLNGLHKSFVMVDFSRIPEGLHVFRKISTDDELSNAVAEIP